MQFVYHLPSHYKYRHGQTRYLMRQMMRNRLPREVVMRKDKAGVVTPAAWIQLQQEITPMFLARISAHYQGGLVDYVDVAALRNHLACNQKVSISIIRLSLMVMMFDHLEYWLLSLTHLKKKCHPETQICLG